VKRLAVRDLRGEGIASCALAGRSTENIPFLVRGVFDGVGSMPLPKRVRTGLKPRRIGEAGDVGGESVWLDMSEPWRVKVLRGVGWSIGALLKGALLAAMI